MKFKRYKKCQKKVPKITWVLKQFSIQLCKIKIMRQVGSDYSVDQLFDCSRRDLENKVKEYRLLDEETS